MEPDTEWENEHMDIHDADRREVLCYLRHGEQEADETVTAVAEQSMAELWEAAIPRHLHREYLLTLGEDYRIDRGCFEARSRNLWGNLKNCDQIIMFVATFGRGADHLIQKYSRLQMSQAVIMQAAAAAMVEEYYDQVCIMIESGYGVKGQYLRPRSSPGYGDFLLECQGMLLEALEAGRHAGIRLADNLLMMPSKFVSAVTGASRRPYRCGVKGCEACVKMNCLYRG